MTARIGLMVFFLTVSSAINGQDGLSVGDIAPGFRAPVQ